MSAIQLPDILSKTATCIIEKVETHSFQGFSNYVKVGDALCLKVFGNGWNFGKTQYRSCRCWKAEKI